MKIDRLKLDLAMAQQCKSISDLRDKFSSTTLAKIRNDPNHRVSPKTVGRLAKALEVDVTDLIDQEDA